MELRHLRYFTAVVQWQGYREASRHLHVAQPAISQAVADLESELGVNLFLRNKRRVSLTPEGEVFHPEALLTLAQAQRAAESARRAARGEVGSLRLGFLGAASYAFLPELVRQYRAQRPGVKITLRELTPTQQAQAFAKGEIDVGFTRTLSSEYERDYASRLLYRDPLLLAVPQASHIKGESVSIARLANEPFVLFHREGAPKVFDTITGLCNEHGFAPKVAQQPDLMQSVLTLVSAEAGVAIVPASARHLWAGGVRFLRLRPDKVRVDFVVVWPKQRVSVALQSFLDLLQAEAKNIARKSLGA